MSRCSTISADGAALGRPHRIRNILKSRQIGATWCFAREALVDALETARNQIFLSASRAGARVQAVPPQLTGILPNNTGGFGDVVKAAQVFVVNELRPLQARFLELNPWLGSEVVRFDLSGYAVSGGAGA